MDDLTRIHHRQIATLLLCYRPAGLIVDVEVHLPPPLVHIYNLDCSTSNTDFRSPSNLFSASSQFITFQMFST
jgi:hypothetical protein